MKIIFTNIFIRRTHYTSITQTILKKNFVWFDLHENYFTNNFLYQNLLDKKKLIMVPAALALPLKSHQQLFKGVPHTKCTLMPDHTCPPSMPDLPQTHFACRDDMHLKGVVVGSVQIQSVVQGGQPRLLSQAPTNMVVARKQTFQRSSYFLATRQ